MSRRIEEIEQALKKLEAFKEGLASYADKQYAIEANVAFLQAAWSIPRYLWWLFTIAPKLDGSRLLELTDFPVEDWDVAMHGRLIELQKRKRPGLIKPLVDAIIKHIQKESRDLVIIDLGAGGMEVDRQVAQWALKTKHPHGLTVVAVDKSPTTRRIAEKNLKELAHDVEIVETGELTPNELERIRKNATKKVLVVMCTNDIFELAQKFQSQYFDLAYHSLFRHHLDATEQVMLDKVIPVLARQHFELDGFKSWFVTIPQTLVGWNYPHFLNGELFSNFRFKTKKEAVAYAKGRGNIRFFWMTGFYLLRYDS